MRIHSNATTNIKQRAFIIQSDESCRSLGREYHVSPTTICRWKGRTSPDDRSCRPDRIHFAFSPEEEKFILSLRRKGLALDDLFDAALAVLPNLCRASVHRLLVRERVNRLPKYQKQEREQPGKFKDYIPGYLHIDCFYLPKIEGKRKYCFVAVDRATRVVYLWVYDNPDKASAVNFLGRCLSFYPFAIHKVLTDNGREFTLANWSRWGRKAKGTHFFDEVCAAVGIEHRLTKPYTPKTNGLVERMNGLIQEDTYKTHRYPGYPELIEELHRWLVCYNLRRQNRTIRRRTPYQVACDWYDKCPNLFIKEPSHLRDTLSTMR